MAIYNAAQLKAIRDLRDDSQDSFSSLCKIWYPSVFIDCPNTPCLPVNSQGVPNIGLHGGPIQTICPLCNGTNQIQQEVTDTLYLMIDWTPTVRTKQKNEAPGIRIPYDFIQIKGYLTDLPKMQRSIQLQAITDTAPIINAKYKLSPDGFDPYGVIQGRYFMAMMERIA